MLLFKLANSPFNVPISEDIFPLAYSANSAEHYNARMDESEFVDQLIALSLLEFQDDPFFVPVPVRDGVERDTTLDDLYVNYWVRQRNTDDLYTISRKADDWYADESRSSTNGKPEWRPRSEQYHTQPHVVNETRKGKAPTAGLARLRSAFGDKPSEVRTPEGLSSLNKARQRNVHQSQRLSSCNRIQS
ncbi:uncharacterized protein HD556DRAFT_1306181 [Suillus plorans]|uniref:Uncharacterized protein n=1 Tax=Suillus plorans TaxID=116603 RepID=A0A9P7J047_9AGAM|nr:uncharacterized protein HD556DRAFT_1306181 [Suillus plorans]KAG1798136.1 hypothetical protein HD556DRAFT_1306181 [Suillus plorans]